jgi:hypothetical protein
MSNPDNYNPVEFYEDDGAALGETGEKVILKMRDDGSHYEVKRVNTIGTGVNNQAHVFSNEEFEEAQDELRIAEYIESNKQKVICNYFVEDYCYHGDKCHFMHPGAGRNADEKILALSQNKYNEDDDT